jgi:GGDEF domain-containing protein
MAATAQSRMVAEKIRANLDKPYVLSCKQEGKPGLSIEYQCTTSIGVVMFLDHGGTQDDLLRWADAVMYRAKDAGGNQICYHEPNP